MDPSPKPKRSKFLKLLFRSGILQTLRKSSSKIASKISAMEAEQADLCARCMTIDLDEVFRTNINTDNGSLVKDLQATVQELESSGCPLCRLFASIGPSIVQDTNILIPTCHLRAFSANKVFNGEGTPEVGDSEDTTLLGVVCMSIADADLTFPDLDFQHLEALNLLENSLQETGYLCAVQNDTVKPRFGLRILIPESFNIEFVNECINYCRMNHGSACRPQKSLNSFRVIDCEARKVVPAPVGCQYLALSYVWGPPNPDANSNLEVEACNLNFEAVPTVINDSIEVALKLKIRYLWVDRFCINQSDQEDKHDQIMQMDSIYANAEMTIIAIAGNGPEYGLPGVSGKLRKRQPWLKIGNRVIASTLTFQKTYIRRSKWATRGWTYQEGLLSRRRLLFGDEQVYFECNGMYCAESLILPLDSMHDKNTMMLKANLAYRTGIQQTPGAHPWEIFKYIAEYSKRQLSYPQDTVAALQGVFNTFENSVQPIYHIMGVPIMPPVAVGRDSIHYKPVPRGVEQCFLIGLCWLHLKPGKRRLNFPSWSWAGWDAPVAYIPRFLPQWTNNIDQCNVQIEDYNNYVTSFPGASYLPGFAKKMSSMARFLLLSVPVLSSDISIVHEKATVEALPPIAEEYSLRLNLAQDTFLYMELYSDQVWNEFETLGSSASWGCLTGIMLGDLSGETKNIVVLVVREVNGQYLRVGICCFETARLKEGTSGLRYFREDDKEAFMSWMKSVPYEIRTIRLG